MKKKKEKRMKNKKLILIPAAVAEEIRPLRPEYRLLSAVGQFEPRRMNCWYPVQNYFPHDAERR